MLSFLQRIGKSLMLPIAILPAAAILVRLGDKDMLNIPFIHGGGQAILDNLPLIFSIGVAIGFSKDQSGTAGLAGGVGYLVLTAAATAINKDINLAVLGGIIAGILAGLMYNRFYKIQLPDWLAFFGGRRFVPIVTSIAMVILGGIFGIIWPPVQQAIEAVGNWIIDSGAIGLGAFGFLNRLLIPTGLHHVVNSLIYFEFGTYKDAAGHIVHGDLTRFFAGDPNGGKFTAGFFPIMMFGLPGACLAMYAAAHKHRRKMLAGFFFGIAFTSFLTGVTEPIEFSFMFLAPFLYVIHALLTGSSLIAANLLGVHDSYGFSAGAIDYLLNFTKAQHPLLLLLQGVVYFFIYFAVFYFAIKRFNLKTPGRDDDGKNGPGDTSWLFDQQVSSPAVKEKLLNDKYTQAAYHYLQDLGGKDNIDSLDHCATRLRLVLKDMSKINESALKKHGASGVMKMGKRNIQVIVGTKVEFVADAMREIIQSDQSFVPPAGVIPEPELENGRRDPLTADDFMMPLDGTLLPIAEVKDEVFSRKMMGDGFAIEPTEGTLISPVDGEVINIFPTKHAISIKSKQGYEILIHLGLDTVDLKGEGFEVLAEENTEIKQGDILIKMDLNLIKEHALSAVTPVVFTNLKENESIELHKTGKMTKGTKGIITIK
ncbi:PTS system N-acetylglucosamine-specific IIC component [Scopulibacillus daqui]|uniref:PTS system N-acetylglucosamine-specific IIC component n=1 Tax=Scopulibacillus daqui TaxID=1469162 RepID=A0ABS2Q372_9BACL|nr:N-acetylglucosamine-specific PTS transporter subunit IIBC [Scopulibacillus daqui]MBM7646144.1 PTS system N-acetylglucosamine-specific IIC component [Scopulibacillus daqui]